MRIGNSIAPHETFEIHELLTFKNVCATKAAAMSTLVTDQELKSMLQQDLTTAQQHIKELQGLLKTSQFATGQTGSVLESGLVTPSH